tara:strand:- start:441 stop:749 length:309 start_codon:yes stop_codon:yes gene_type:complete
VTKKRHSKARTGDIAEHYAITWLWDNGYEVFLNPGANGPIDLIAYKDGKCILVDVKSLWLDKACNSWKNSGTRTARQKEMGVVFLGFNPRTRKLRWIQHRET